MECRGDNRTPPRVHRQRREPNPPFSRPPDCIYSEQQTRFDRRHDDEDRPSDPHVWTPKAEVTTSRGYGFHSLASLDRHRKLI